MLCLTFVSVFCMDLLLERHQNTPVMKQVIGETKKQKWGVSAPQVIKYTHLWTARLLRKGQH